MRGGEFTRTKEAGLVEEGEKREERREERRRWVCV